MFEIHKSKLWDTYDKNCWFYELNYFTFNYGQETGTEFIALWRQFVCSDFFTPCYWGEIQRLRKIMSSDSEWNSFANLSKSSDEDIMVEDKEDVEESLTHKLTSHVDVTWRFGHAIQMRILNVK